MVHQSPVRSDDASVASGRRVKHSRQGCVLCKTRRIRCSEEKPSCARCAKDGRICEYVVRLTWEEDSLSRGIKHGRAARSRPTDRISSSGLAERSQIPATQYIQDYGSYFINTNVLDVEGKPIHKATACVRYRRPVIPRTLNSTGVYGLSSMDGALFQYYQSQVCHDLTLVDDISNGYRHIVLPMSTTYESVMESVLAMAALYLDLNTPSTSIDYYAIALRHKQKALNGLRQDLATDGGAHTDHVLVSMLMLCLLDIADGCQTSWPQHLSAAANLLSDRSVSLREPSLASFISKFFAARDVMSRTACGARSKFKQIAWQQPHEIDNTVGCSYELMEIISSITDLTSYMVTIIMTVNEPNADESQKTDINQNIVTTQKLVEIETQLDNLIQTLPSSSSSLPPTETIFLSNTSKIIHVATKIYFYTALHSALPSTYLIRSLVGEQMSLIESMPYLRSAHLWSIFVTALYVSGDEERIFFLRQFDRLEAASAAIGPTQAAKAVLETVWKRRDLEFDAGKLKTDESGLSDWARLVRPLSDGLSLA
ncbi:Transcriptional activator protein [Lachnellula occidentalis]|uniref:Transcriptional activator protein n=1 Tax=Lachnellula occidentalis TaxID=215460 RepID=A0A8H8RZR3_9HELO|nr:Transcriptional activator protein [Lachnellula occidentalis]